MSKYKATAVGPVTKTLDPLQLLCISHPIQNFMYVLKYKAAAVGSVSEILDPLQLLCISHPILIFFVSVGPQKSETNWEQYFREAWKPPKKQASLQASQASRTILKSGCSGSLIPLQREYLTLGGGVPAQISTCTRARSLTKRVPEHSTSVSQHNGSEAMHMLVSISSVLAVYIRIDPRRPPNRSDRGVGKNWST